MKKKFSKFMAMVLAAVMLLTLVPAMAMADGATYSVFDVNIPFGNVYDCMRGGSSGTEQNTYRFLSVCIDNPANRMEYAVPDAIEHPDNYYYKFVKDGTKTDLVLYKRDDASYSLEVGNCGTITSYGDGCLLYVSGEGYGSFVSFRDKEYHMCGKACTNRHEAMVNNCVPCGCGETYTILKKSPTFEELEALPMIGELVEIPHKHVFDAETGKCTCGLDGNIDYSITSKTLADVQDVFDGVADVTESNGVITIKLTSDISGRIYFNDNDGNFVLDLNGKTISPGTIYDQSICVDHDFTGSLTITGNGTIKKGKHDIIYVSPSHKDAVKIALQSGYDYFTAKADGNDIFGDERNTTTKTYAQDITSSKYYSKDELVITQCILVHTHSWSYAIKDEHPETIVATCTGSDGECDATNTELTIIAPLHEEVNDGKNASATLSASSIGGVDTIPQIYYREKDRSGEYIGEATTTAPENKGGLYEAYITIEGVKAYVAYSIVPLPALTYTVTFDANGHGTAPDAINDVTEGNTIPVPTPPVAEGYVFGGWYKEAACENEWDFDNDTVTENITLYALWTEDSSGEGEPVSNDYKILRHDLAHVQEVLSGVADVTQDGDSIVIKLTSDIDSCLYIGEYNFQWWDGDFVLDLNGKKIETDDTYDYTIGLERNFEGSLTITGEGTIKGSDYFLISVATGALNFSIPDGYVLKIDGEESEAEAVYGNVVGNELVIEQQSNPIETYTVTFDANGGSVTPENAVTDADGKLASLPTPERTGKYVFKGWYTASKGGTAVTADTVYTEDTTIYARWTYKSSGGGGISTYTVKFETNGGTTLANRVVAINVKLAEPAAPVKDGFKFDGWYTDKELTVAYDFNTKVKKNFTLYAKWTEIEKEPEEEPENDNPADTEKSENLFTDVNENEWFFTDVEYAVENSLFNGTSETEFTPNGIITRGMMVTVLYRAEGEPAVNRSIPFADIDMGAYYVNAVIWAQQNGIVNGVSETEFAPDVNITREQIAAIMFRYAQHKGMEAMTLEENLHFEDAGEISEYAVSAMNWAVGTGLMNGKSATTVNPKDNATRAEIAAITRRFIENNK